MILTARLLDGASLRLLPLRRTELPADTSLEDVLVGELSLLVVLAGFGYVEGGSLLRFLVASILTSVQALAVLDGVELDPVFRGRRLKGERTRRLEDFPSFFFDLDGSMLRFREATAAFAEASATLGSV